MLGVAISCLTFCSLERFHQLCILVLCQTVSISAFT